MKSKVPAFTLRAASVRKKYWREKQCRTTMKPWREGSAPLYPPSLFSSCPRLAPPLYHGRSHFLPCSLRTNDAFHSYIVAATAAAWTVAAALPGFPLTVGCSHPPGAMVEGVWRDVGAGSPWNRCRSRFVPIMAL